MPRPRWDRDVRKKHLETISRPRCLRPRLQPYDLLSHSQFVPHCTLTVSVLMLSKMWHIPHREVNIATWHDCRMSTSTVVYMCACVCVEFVFQCRISWLEEGDMWTATSACPAGRLAWRGFTGVLVYYPRDAMLARVIEIATCLSVRLSVHPSVRPSRAGIVSKRRKLAAWFLHHLVAPRL